MFHMNQNLKVVLAVDPVDLRKSFNGLYAIARNELGEVPESATRERGETSDAYFLSTGFAGLPGKQKGAPLERNAFSLTLGRSVASRLFPRVREDPPQEGLRSRFPRPA